MRRRRSFANARPFGQDEVRNRISLVSVGQGNFHRTQPIKPFKIIESRPKQVAERNEPNQSNQTQKPEEGREDFLSKTQVLPRRRSFDEPFPSTLKRKAERSRSNQKQAAQSPRNRSLDSESSWQRETAELIQKVNENIQKFKQAQGVQQQAEAPPSEKATGTERDKANPEAPSHQVAALQPSVPSQAEGNK